jgi:CrcB protein
VSSDRTRPEPDRPRTHWYQHHDASLPVDPDLAPSDPGGPSSAHRPSVRVQRSRQFDVLFAIFVGGILGALARYELGLSWPTPAGHFPWTTFTINVSGSLFLGATLTLLLEIPVRWRYLRPFVCVGFTGAWTTMSTFALETDLLIKDHKTATAVLYVVATVVLGLSATAIGTAAAQRVRAKG